jgi:hypothetical protein
VPRRVSVTRPPRKTHALTVVDGAIVYADGPFAALGATSKAALAIDRVSHVSIETHHHELLRRGHRGIKASSTPKYELLPRQPAMTTATDRPEGPLTRCALRPEGVNAIIGCDEDSALGHDRRLESSNANHRLRRTSTCEDPLPCVAVKASQTIVAFRPD